MKQYILHLDRQLRGEDPVAAFVLNENLDDSHLLIKDEAVEYVQRKVEELQVRLCCSNAHGHAQVQIMPAHPHVCCLLPQKYNTFSRSTESAPEARKPEASDAPATKKNRHNK